MKNAYLLIGLALSTQVLARPYPVTNNLRVKTSEVRVSVNRPDSDICGLTIVTSKFLVPTYGPQALVQNLKVQATNAHTGQRVVIQGLVNHETGLVFYPTSRVFGYAGTFEFSSVDGSTLNRVVTEALSLEEDDVAIIQQVGCEEL